MELKGWEWKLTQVTPDYWTYEVQVETACGRIYRNINRNGKRVLHHLALRNAKRACLKLQRKVEAKQLSAGYADDVARMGKVKA
jgi:hypothetical protein